MKVDLEHPEYRAKVETWRRYRDLYIGGDVFKANAAQYLTPRQKEPRDVYAERLSRVFYENYVGSIIDWFAATLFRREPVLQFDGPGNSGREFFEEFTEDCDRRGTTLPDFLRRQFVEALVTGSSYVLVDFPRVTGKVTNRAEEEASGAARAYLLGVSPTEVINWSCDDYGRYEWVVVRQSHVRAAGPEENAWVNETRWTYYDKERFRSYRRLENKGNIELIDEGRHGLAGIQKVPLFRLEVPEGLWLMNKAGLLQVEHFNKSNALAWALTMGLFAMPVVYSEKDFDQVAGESYYLQLGPTDRFGWTEPEGKVFQIAADNLTRLKDEIYRVCYMMSQAGGPFSSSVQVSGLSKQRDFAITQEVLRAYGDAIKALLKQVLRAIAGARQDDVDIEVSGLDEFDIGDFSAEVADAQQLLALNIPSPTLHKQILKRLAQKYLCDVRQEVKDRIAGEIEEAA